MLAPIRNFSIMLRFNPISSTSKTSMSAATTISIILFPNPPHGIAQQSCNHIIPAQTDTDNNNHPRTRMLPDFHEDTGLSHRIVLNNTCSL